MKQLNRNRFTRRICAVVLLVSCIFTFSVPFESTQAVAILPAFASVLLTIFQNLANAKNKNGTGTTTTKPAKGSQPTTDLQNAQGQLKVYAQRETLISNISNCIGYQAKASLTRMLQISGGTNAITPDAMDEMKTNLWPDVTAALDAVVKATPKLDPNLFAGDTNAMQAVKNIMSADGALKEKITKELDYDPNKPKKVLLSDLQVNLNKLAEIFLKMDDVTSDELLTLSTGLAAVTATNPPAPKDPNGTTAAAADVAHEVFGNPDALAEAKKLNVKLGKFTGVVASLKKDQH